MKFFNKRIRGFTLVELLVVLAILSILMFIVTPRFASIVNPERTKNFILTLQNSLRYLSEKAILEQQLYLFNFDLDEGRYYFTVPLEDSEGDAPEGEVVDRYLKPAQLPPKLKVIKVIILPGEEIDSGKLAMPFTPNGMLLSFEMHFAGVDGRSYVMTGNSYNNRIQLFVSNNEEEWRSLD
jgi:prepilin-type N-terminal cleavage/methylation domain-containing protein